MIHVLIASTLLLLVRDVTCEDNDYYYGSDSEDDNQEYKDTLYDSIDWPLNLEGSLRQRMALNGAIAEPGKSFVCSPISALMPLGKLALGATGICQQELHDAVGVNTKTEVKHRTNGMIEKIITPNSISPSASVILVNAVYFSGKWQKKFGDAEMEDFYTATDIRKVPMMTREARYRYHKNDALDCQIIEIPYVGGQASFVIFLPNTRDGLPLLLYKLKLAPDLMQSAMSKMRVEQVMLSIPKFKTETEIDLRVSYEKLGLIQILKTANSGLNKIVTGDKHLYVSKGIQKAVIEVNEYGTRAAAASVLEVSLLSMVVNQRIFNANRPFYYFIKFKKEKIFTGVYN